LIKTGHPVRRAFDWLFRSRDRGRYTVVQWPNVALAVVIVCTVARWLLDTQGALDQTLHWTGSVAIAWWSVDEIIRGVNPFRRVLGVVILTRLVIRIVAPGSALG
jgi:hypothetical protein